MGEVYSTWEFLLRACVGGAVLYLLYQLLLSRHADFRIDLRDGRVKCTKGVPLALRAQLADFLLHDLALEGPLKILGARRGGRMSVWFRGQLRRGDEQRIRNFLLTRL
jgi:hypothetical protein